MRDRIGRRVGGKEKFSDNIFVCRRFEVDYDPVADDRYIFAEERRVDRFYKVFLSDIVKRNFFSGRGNGFAGVFKFAVEFDFRRGKSPRAGKNRNSVFHCKALNEGRERNGEFGGGGVNFAVRFDFVCRNDSLVFFTLGGREVMAFFGLIVSLAVEFADINVIFVGRNVRRAVVDFYFLYCGRCVVCSDIGDIESGKTAAVGNVNIFARDGNSAAVPLERLTVSG